MQKKETNKHTVVECERYATARQQFALKTGVTITTANYIDVMALNAKKLNVAPSTLAKALCQLLAHIMKKHRQENNNDNTASVAVPLCLLIAYCHMLSHLRSRTFCGTQSLMNSPYVL